ncbi:MAG: hypothetical protein AVDCRST_MAG64-2064, partial [uncultured Phycisphaerae bacterium]
DHARAPHARRGTRENRRGRGAPVAPRPRCVTADSYGSVL